MVDDTGPVIVDNKCGGNKCGGNKPKTAAILARLHISDNSGLKLSTQFDTLFTGAVGTAEHLSAFTEHVGIQRSSNEW